MIPISHNLIKIFPLQIHYVLEYNFCNLDPTYQLSINWKDKIRQFRLYNISTCPVASILNLRHLSPLALYRNRTRHAPSSLSFLLYGAKKKQFMVKVRLATIHCGKQIAELLALKYITHICTPAGFSFVNYWQSLLWCYAKWPNLKNDMLIPTKPEMPLHWMIEKMLFVTGKLELAMRFSTLLQLWQQVIISQRGIWNLM